MSEQIFPKKTYTSKDWFEKELAQLYSKSWAMVGLASGFANTGDYVITKVENNPIAVVQNNLKDLPDDKKDSEYSESVNWKKHPLETENYQTEGILRCEKMQRSLIFPTHEVGPLANSSSGEDLLPIFQNSVKEHLK